MNRGTPREVGYLPRILRARRNLQLILSERQTQILIGSVLGDGYIYPRGRVQIEHTDKHQQYLLWKFDELKSLAYGNPTIARRRDVRNGREYCSYRFWLRQYFRPWRQYFYQGKTKVFPESLVLTPLSLAIWYMDDGCFSYGCCTISTESFSPTSQQRIQGRIWEQFRVKTYIRSNGKLAVRAEDQTTFFLVIQPHIHRSMQYKIP